MQFRILGPLEVVHKGACVPIGGPRPAAALAILLVEHEHAIPLHRLVDFLWGAEPPETARRQVQNTFAAIRRRFARLGTDPIERIGDSYRITAPDLDYRHFRQIVAQARSQAASDQYQEAATLLAEALGLWRGSALTNLRNPRLSVFAEHLEEERVTAIEDLIDAELALGRFDAARARAHLLLSDHTYREQTVQRLMLALHGGGRTAEALEVFLQFRARLVEDLGMDPGDGLMHTHRQIIQGDAGCAGQMTVVARASGPSLDEHPVTVPMQLPADTAAFVGRERELSTLDGILSRSGGAVAVVAGQGGSGKTALVTHWGHLQRARFPDGQLYINLRGFDTASPLEPIEALHSLLRSLLRPGSRIPASTDEAAALYRSILSRKQMLVVLDNARTAAQVRPLLPGRADTVTIVTSRNRMQGLIALHDAMPVHIGSLSPSNAVDLLRTVSRRGEVASEVDALRHIAELCDRLPLPLRIAGANLASRVDETADKFAAGLSDESARLELLAVQNDQEAALTAVFDRSVLALDASARRMLWLLGALPGEDFHADLVASVYNGPRGDARRAVSALGDCHLIEEHRAGRYRFHDLIRLYASRRQQTELGESERAETITRFIEWHFRERRANEYDNLVNACRDLADHPKIWRVTLALHPHIKHGFGMDLLHRLATHAKEQSERHADLAGLTQMHNFLSGVATMRGDLEAAKRHGELAVELISRHGTGDDDGAVRNTYGSVLYHHGRVHDAEPYIAEAVAAAEATGNARLMVTRLTNYGAVFRRLGRYQEAEAHLKRAITLMEQTGESSLARIGLGMVYTEQGRNAEAEPIVAAALREAMERRGPRIRSIALFASAELRLRCGDLDRAREDLEKSCEIAARHGILNEFDPRGLRCKVLERQGDYSQARLGIENMLADTDNARGPAFAARTWLIAAEVTAWHDPQFALEYGVRARDSFAAWRIPVDHGRSLLALAQAHAALDDPRQARTLAARAQQTFAEIGVLEAHQAARLLGLAD